MLHQRDTDSRSCPRFACDGRRPARRAWSAWPPTSGPVVPTRVEMGVFPPGNTPSNTGRNRRAAWNRTGGLGPHRIGRPEGSDPRLTACLPPRGHARTAGRSRRVATPIPPRSPGTGPRRSDQITSRRVVGSFLERPQGTPTGIRTVPASSASRRPRLAGVNRNLASVNTRCRPGTATRVPGARGRPSQRASGPLHRGAAGRQLACCAL
jgi:hypothetical protein